MGPPAGWWTDYALYRQVVNLQDMIQGLEERLKMKDGTLSNNRDRIISLGTEINEKDARIEQTEVKLGHCQDKSEEGFTSYQCRTLKLEEEKRN